jgi:hypothetical protein
MAAAAASGMLGGCAESLSVTRLPDFMKLPDKVLTTDQQRRTVNDMIEKGQTHRDDAVREIEKGK